MRMFCKVVAELCNVRLERKFTKLSYATIQNSGLLTF